MPLSEREQDILDELERQWDLFPIDDPIDENLWALVAIWAGLIVILLIAVLSSHV